MRFPEGFIDQVRESTSIVDLIGQYVALQKAGSSFRGLCPFPGHQEKTPSFFVNDNKQLYHCFGCKKSGSVYNFLMDFQGLTFPEAVEALAQRAGIPLPVQENQSPAQQRTHDERETLYKLNRYAGAHFAKNLASKPESHPVKQYIKARGLSDEVIKEFKLGYAEASWHDLVDTLKRGRAPFAIAEKLGLIKRKKNGDHYDMFHDRLMFPILAANGNVIGFGGRSLDSGQQPKYLNSPETPLFHKGRTLYGLHATAKYIRAEDKTFVVEGYMDLIALYQFGIKNVVATLGTAFTMDHALAIKKICSKVVVLFDGDEAGLAAADKSLPVFLESGLFSHCLTLPGQRDPDEFLREFGTDEFNKLAEKAPDHFLQFMNRKMTYYRGQPSEKVEILNSLTPLLERVKDQRLKMLYLQSVAQALEMPPQMVAQQVKVNATQHVENTVKSVPKPPVTKVPTEESILVQFMLERREYLEWIQTSGIIEKFSSDEARMAAVKIVEKYCQNPNDFDKLGASLISQGQEGPEKDQAAESPAPVRWQFLLAKHLEFSSLNSELDDEGEKKLIEDCLTRVRERDLKIRSRSILNSIKIDQDSSREKLEVFLKIAKEQKGPKSP